MRNVSEYSSPPENLSRFRWFDSNAGILFCLWALWLALEYFGFGPVSYLRIHDNGDSYVPAKLALLANHQIGFWNPQWLSGTDRLSGLLATSDLDTPLFLFLPSWLAYALVMWLQRFVAGYFTFRLLRDTLDLDVLPALYAGLFYSLFSQNALNGAWAGFKIDDGLSMAGLPFLLWAFPRIDLKRTSWACLLAFGIGILFALNSIYVFAVFIILFIPFWFLFVVVNLKPRFWVILFLFVVGWMSIEFPVLWAGLSNGPLSQRADTPIISPLESKFLGITTASGFVQDNIWPLVLGCLGLIVSRARERRLVALAGLIAISLAFVAGYHIIRGLAYSHLGFLAGFQFDRIYLVFPFLSTVFGAVSLQVMGAIGLRLVYPVRIARGWVEKAVSLKVVLA